MSRTRVIPVDLLVRNWDKEAAVKLTPEQLERYYADTRKARQDWQQAQAIYEHSSGAALVRRHPWRQLEASAASHFLEYQASLWTVFMSLRVGAHKPDKG